VAASVAWLVAEFAAVAKEPIIAASRGCAAMADLIHTDLGAVAELPVVAVGARRTATNFKAEIAHAESKIVGMSIVGDPEGAIAVGASDAPAILAQVGLFVVIPADEQDGMASLDCALRLDIDLSVTPVLPVVIEVTEYGKAPVAWPVVVQ
jgi:hypothetical protein